MGNMGECGCCSGLCKTIRHSVQLSHYENNIRLEDAGEGGVFLKEVVEEIVVGLQDLECA